MPPKRYLRCRLQEPHHRSARTFVQHRLTRRSLESDGFLAIGGSNLPRSGELRGCLNAHEDALDISFICGRSDLAGADEYQPQHRPDQEECGPKGSVFAGEGASCDYRGDASRVEQSDQEKRHARRRYRGERE